MGTRFLPVTKSIPKEMLPIIDTPLIQHAVNEAVSAGIESLIFINGKNKRAIEDYFDRDTELENRLEQRNKVSMLECLHKIIPDNVSCAYLRQFDPLGLGHAVSCASPVIDNEPFAVILADDLIITNNGDNVLSKMIDLYHQHQCSVIAVEEVPESETSHYGIISGNFISDDVLEVSNFIEKPVIGEATSNLAIIGRYILTPGILKTLKRTQAGVQSEVQLTDALIELSKTEKIIAWKFSGKRYDCGSKTRLLVRKHRIGAKSPCNQRWTGKIFA